MAQRVWDHSLRGRCKEYILNEYIKYNFLFYFIYIPHSSCFCIPHSFSFSLIFPHFLASQTPLSLLQWPTSSPTTRSPSSRRPSASSTRMAMVSLLRSLSVFFLFSLSSLSFFPLSQICFPQFVCSWGHVCVFCVCKF